MDRLVARSELGLTIDSLRASRGKVVFTNGCFDILHPGHIRLLRKCGELGGLLIVAINNDASVKRLKGPTRPIYREEERAEILLALRWVDLVTVFDEDTPIEAIRIIHPDVLVKGGEYLERDIVGSDLVRGYGGDVVRIPMKKGHATRRIVARLAGDE